MRCMKVVLPEPAMPTQTIATGPLVDGGWEDVADGRFEAEAGVVVAIMADARVYDRYSEPRCSSVIASAAKGRRILSEDCLS